MSPHLATFSWVLAIICALEAVVWVDSFTIRQYPRPVAVPEVVALKASSHRHFTKRPNSHRPWPSTARLSYASTALWSSSSSESSDVDDENASSSGDGIVVDYTNEETLLCIDLAVNDGVDFDIARQKVSKFCQSFPFAAVLPVQPLHYVPVYDDGGVEVKFLRKKTALKSSMDGGMRFFLEPPLTLSSGQENDAASTRVDMNDIDAEDGIDDDDDDSESMSPPRKNAGIIQITAKRNSQGQTIAKLFAEKLVVTSFVAAITGRKESTSSFGATAPSDYVRVQSLYHKWM